MIHIGFTILLWLTAGPAVIGHDIEVVWKKGYTSSDSAFGRGLSAGDVDGDGYLDIAASFGIYDRPNSGWLGGVYIFSSNPLDTFVDITIWTHEQVGSGPNIVVMDINDDGVADLMAGNQGASKVVIYFGPLVDSQEVDAWMTDEELRTMGMGASLANAGDVNTDGWEDLIIGSPYSRYGDVGGAAYIYFGGPGFSPGEHDPDVIIAGHGGGFGWQVGGGGDFNADGFDDVIVGAPDANSIYIYFGGDPMDTVEDVNFYDQEARFLAESPIDLLHKENGAHAVFGSELWPGEGATRPGKAYVLFGGKDYDNIPDVEIIGRTDSSYLTAIGGTVSTGDADHDGRDDFITGSVDEFYSEGTYYGAAYFYRGGNVIDSICDGWLEGEANDAVASRFAPAGDFDDDGRNEFLVSHYTPVIFPKVWLCKFTGVGVKESEGEDKRLRLELSATVTQEAVRFYYDKPLNKEASLTIYDVSGALVRRYRNLTESSVQWDLRDEQGRKVPSGVYTARLDIKDGGATARKVVVLR
ncbi:hypothetical protein ES703_01403 [subsurface metagenome]